MVVIRFAIYTGYKTISLVLYTVIFLTNTSMYESLLSRQLRANIYTEKRDSLSLLAEKVPCWDILPQSIKSSPPALPFDTLVTGMVWPIVFPNQITEMHILHEVRTQKRKLARVWVSHECREGAVNGHQRVVKLGANTANTVAFRNESLCMEWPWHVPSTSNS